MRLSVNLTGHFPGALNGGYGVRCNWSIYEGDDGASGEPRSLAAGPFVDWQRFQGRRRSGALPETECELGCSLVMLPNLIPGDNVPNRLEIVRPPILIKEIVRVLPDIDSENWFKTIANWVVLIRGGNDFE
jgi:hypothetical protein